MKKLVMKSKLSLAVLLLLSAPAYAQESRSQAYSSYVKNSAIELITYLKGLSASTKIGILAVLAFLAILAYLRSRDTPGNNIRRARELHSKAIELHEKGETEEAASHYKKAAEYREKAEAQK